MRIWLSALAMLWSVYPAFSAPRVITDIAPVHSLAAQVMEGVGTPYLLIAPGTSPHHYALRPSDARQLDRADAVFWIGGALTPWLEHPLEALADDAVTIELLHDAGTGSDGQQEGHDDHGHGGIDPHIWLDPVEAAKMVTAIATTLSGLDPENAETYRANAARARDALAALETEIAATLPAQKPYIVFHDAYGHFERRFGIAPVAAVSLSDAMKPGPKRIAEIRRLLQSQGVVCAFTEPQFPERLVSMALSGSNARTGVLDPLGAAFEPGPDLYGGMMRDIARSIRDCLEDANL